MHSLLRQRLRLIREKHGLSQEEMTRRMGLGDRQALSEIENGGREISADELARAAGALGTTVFALSDPFQLVGEGRFSWRETNVTLADLDAFESKAGRWIAAYRHLSGLRGTPLNSALRRINLTTRSTFEDAQQEGEAVAKLLELGEIPAQQLAIALQETLDTLILYVDAIPGISGAACQVGALNAIIVNRNEPTGRRNFDLAHEFFHLLTWETMPPKRIDTAGRGQYKRVEDLAENFAAGLLMPSSTIRGIIERSSLPEEDELQQWIAATAGSMLVSPTAMLWRLVTLGYISQAAGKRLRAKTGWREPNQFGNERPPAFSPKLMALLAWSIDQGYVSARRTADLLDTNLDGLASLFATHNVTCPYEL